MNTPHTDFKKQPGPYPDFFMAQLALQQGYCGNPNPQIVGYGRVSTEEQSLDMQTAALAKAGVQVSFVEKLSAVNAKRPQFHLMQKYLRSGDTLVAYAYSRFSRNLKQLLTFVDAWKAKAIRLKSTSEPHIKPFTTSGRLVLSVTGAVDENELGRIRDRTVDGMAERKRQGQYMGRPILVTPEMIKLAKKLRWKDKVPVAEISRRLKVSASAIYANT